jgi:hypothetical protein
MTKPIIYTPDVLASIPGMVAQNMSREEIAAQFGVTVASLQVTCCKKRISLRRPKLGSPRILHIMTPQEPRLKLSRAANFVLHLQAEKRASDVNALAKQLLEIIAKDNLFDAVLDCEEVA